MHPRTDACKACGHKVAQHEYTFEVVDGFQVRSGGPARATPLPALSTARSCALPPPPLRHRATCSQEYTMTCDLCGTGSASVSVAPADPRQTGGVF